MAEIQQTTTQEDQCTTFTEVENVAYGHCISQVPNVAYNAFQQKATNEKEQGSVHYEVVNLIDDSVENQHTRQQTENMDVYDYIDVNINMK